MRRHRLHAAPIIACLLGVGLLAYGGGYDKTQERPKITSEASLLHNGWRLTPAGTAQKVGDMLLGGALSPDKRQFAVVNAGYNAHHLYLLDALTGKVQQTLPLERAWNGVAWSPDGNTLYVSGGGLPRVHVFTRGDGGAFQPAAPLPLPDLTANPPEQRGAKPDPEKGQAYVSGLAISHDGKTLYVGNFATDTVYALSLPDGAVKTQRRLDAVAHPYCLRLSPEGDELYVTQGALGSVAVLNAATLAPARTLFTDSHPNDLLFGPEGDLFVSCGNSDTVCVLNPKTGQGLERIAVTLTPLSPAGTTPNSLALSPDGKTLYVANADNNDVAVVDLSEPRHSRVKGFIPTGWYPTLVCVAPDGKHLLLGSGKGMGAGPNARPNPNATDPIERTYTYVGTLLYGLISTLEVPQDSQLAAYTQQVMANTPYRDTLLAAPAIAPRPGSPIPARVGEKSPIKHILYIIKENRTYDQVFGDMKEGNGDSSLTLFGEKVTPNLHALAREYVLLDNTYCNGDVSGNGHPWSTAAYGTDFGERAWMQSYGGHADWPLKDKDLYPPVGRIWDMCERKGLTFASYYYTWTTDNTHRNMPKTWEENLNKLRDFENADLFIADLKRYEQNNNLPNFLIMDLREDHTEGTRPGSFTPQACVASNDLGVGKIVEACSHSKYWPEMAIFIIQDDAQDGPDHMEAHRTEALVISPYTRQHKVDSTFYTTCSLLRTMELILGLPPMSQYDAAATPMYRAFMSKPDLTPFKALSARVDVMEKNKATAFGAKASQQMDFSGPDRLTAAQVDTLNRILWHSVKGDMPYPSPVHRALLAPTGQALVTSVGKDGDD
ncbi:MAG TPA: bifunctional YncE family protein/alkaline phosphatase family protein [Chthonomonadaceae bacterium]|nr:bifunctional YncE family protein/alkaline phosphatase family protein [Chthonomonadaceae bacterium]